MKNYFEKNFNDILEVLPGIVHINELSEGAPLVYINKIGCEILGLTVKEFEKIDKNKLNNYIVHPETMENVTPLLFNFIQDQNRSKTITFFQKLRPYKSDEYFWVLTSTRFFQDKYLLSFSTTLSTMEYDKLRIENFLEDRLIAQKHKKQFLTLSAREIKVLDCVGKGLSSKQISEVLDISNSTSQNYIHSIKKKFYTGNGPLPSLADLIVFARVFKV